MEKLEFVREIFKSERFLSQSPQEKRATLNDIIATGEISEQDALILFNEAIQEQRSVENREDKEEVTEDKRLERVMANFDYNTFLNFILRGDIKGKDLIRLCNSSKKFSDYCNRSFQLQNDQGLLIGEPQDQYLFRLLLNKMRVRIQKSEILREIYIDKTIGGNVLAFGQHNNWRLGLGGTTGENILIPTLNTDLKNIVQISSGSDHTLCLDNEGRVWGFGNNNHYQLGLDHPQFKAVPVLIPSLKDIIRVAAGVGYSLCLDKQGKVWSFGSNDNGRLGLVSEAISYPSVISNLGNIIDISAGDHSLCLDDHGRVWSFGLNLFGELGLGNRQVQVPTLIPNFGNIVQVSAGNGISHCLDNQGRVWSFGANVYGELGLGDYQNRDVPTMIPNLSNIVQISGNNFHCLCLDDEGNVWAFGNNQTGELGMIDPTNHRQSKNTPTMILDIANIVQVTTGEAHSLCLDRDGHIWSFGQNDYGQLGLGDTAIVYEPTMIPNLNNIIQVSSGRFNSFCIQGKK